MKEPVRSGRDRNSDSDSGSISDRDRNSGSISGKFSGRSSGTFLQRDADEAPNVAFGRGCPP